MSEEENIPEERPTNDNPQPNEINSLQEPISQLPPQTENMEVHKHPHHLTHQKNGGKTDITIICSLESCIPEKIFICSF